MASLKEIKGRIASVQSTQKITSAMKMVASAKLHRAQAAITGMAPYERKLSAILNAFLAGGGEDDRTASPLTAKRTAVRRVVIVAFSSNSSLCGAFNSNVAKELHETILSFPELTKEQILVHPVGKKIAQAARKEQCTIVGSYEKLAEQADFDAIAALAYQLMDDYARGEIDRVILLYHRFKSASSQVLERKELLPVSLDDVFSSSQAKAQHPALAPDYIVEPSRSALLATLLPQTIALNLFTALLDNQASEHAARMTAMQVATDNAADLLDDLTLHYNKSRQYAITSELLDIIGGSMQ